VLSGLIKCAVCGKAMAPVKTRATATRPSPTRPYFRCNTRKEHGACRDLCDNGTIDVARMEGIVRRWVARYADEVDAAAASAAQRVARTSVTMAEADALARELGDLDAALNRLTGQLARGLVPESAYVAARDELVAQRGALATRLGTAERVVAKVSRAEPAAYRGLLADWDTLDVAVRRTMLKDLIASVLIRTGRSATVTVRTTWGETDKFTTRYGDEADTEL
jgi:hypothetical protein